MYINFIKVPVKYFRVVYLGNIVKELFKVLLHHKYTVRGNNFFTKFIRTLSGYYQGIG